MNIGYDGKRAANNLTGLGNYSRSLISQLADLYPENQYFVYTPRSKNSPQIRTFFDLADITLRLPTSLLPLWRALGIKRQLQEDQIELFHGLSHEIPVGLKIPSVVTIHDLIFLLLPGQFSRIDRLIYKLKIQYACKHANRIIAISERTKQDIIKLFNVDEEKIEVVYQSCNEIFKSPANDKQKRAVKQKYDLPDQYILNVGTIEARKNLVTLIRALSHIKEDYKLVVIGKETPYMKQAAIEIKKLNLGQRIIFLKNVPFQDLPAIYQLSALFVYPSVYEGFGIPLIEAIHSGVPVIAASGSCLEEAGGENSLYVAPDDHLGFAETINRVLGDQALKENMISSGLLYVERFNSKLIAEQIMRLYKQIISE